MGRPRVHVNRHGKPVKTNTGVSYHKATRCFYILDQAGRRKYYKSWSDARTMLALATAGSEPTVFFEVLDEGPDSDLLPPDGMPPEDVREDHPYHRWWADLHASGQYPTKPLPIPAEEFWREVAYQFDVNPERFVERLPIIDYLTQTGRVTTPDKGEGPSLKRIGAVWKEVQLAKHGEPTQHVSETLARWEKFCRVVGGRNRRVDTLQAKDFRDYHAAVAKLAAAESKSAKWYNNTCSAPKLVLHRVAQRYPELKIPAEVVLWAGCFDPRPYAAKKSNRTPVSPDEFAALVAACREWARTDPDQFDTTTQSGQSRRLHAKRKRRAGVQMEAALRLGLNCALDPIYIARLEWSDLHLDADPPYMDFGRHKVAHKVGGPIDRCTPLLPATVAALKAWREYDGRSEGPVFLTAARGAFTSERTCRAFKSLKVTAGIKSAITYKHLRNCASTIAYRKLRSKDLADMILGHTIPRSARDYVGDPTDPMTLQELVSEVGRTYGV